MQTLNYIGCKNTLFKTILKVCQDNIPNINELSFMDMFAGTGIMSYNMQMYSRNVSANDLEYYSFVIINALLKCNYNENLQQIIDLCNELEPNEGLVYHNFSLGGEEKRMFFTEDNAKKCDAIRLYIENIYTEGQITQYEYYFLIASLLVSIDKVANISVVYGAFLKAFKSSALKPLILRPIHQKNDIKIEDNRVFNEKAEDIAEYKEQWDIVYCDPPYNSRVYSSNYSPLNYIARYNSELNVVGKTGLLENYNRSGFSSKVNALQSFKDMIMNITCRYIILSYNNEGILKLDAIKDVLLTRGNVKLYKIKYPKFKAQVNVAIKFVEEYIWFVECGLESSYEMIEMDNIVR